MESWMHEYWTQYCDKVTNKEKYFILFTVIENSKLL